MAVSEKLMETSLVTKDQLEQYFVSSKHRIGHEFLATGKNSSSLTSLYLGKFRDMVEVCDTEPVPLPIKVKAFILGY